MKKFYLSLFILLSISFSQVIYAEILSGSGFIPGQIWYSKDNLIEGDTVLIHTAVWNGEDYDINTKVDFYDGNIILGSRDVSIKKDELKEVSVSWKVTSGDHIISAKISYSVNNISKEKVSLSRISTTPSKSSVSRVVKNDDGEVVSFTNEIKDKIEEILPDNVEEIVSVNFNSLENLRVGNSKKVSGLKDEAKNNLEIVKVDKNNNNFSSDKNLEDFIKEPLAYVKLFFFSVLSFILSNKIVFYGVLIIFVFSIIRFTYRKIRNI